MNIKSLKWLPWWSECSPVMLSYTKFNSVCETTGEAVVCSMWMRGDSSVPLSSFRTLSSSWSLVLITGGYAWSFPWSNRRQKCHHTLYHLLDSLDVLRTSFSFQTLLMMKHKKVSHVSCVLMNFFSLVLLRSFVNDSWSRLVQQSVSLRTLWNMTDGGTHGVLILQQQEF